MAERSEKIGFLILAAVATAVFGFVCICISGRLAQQYDIARDTLAVGVDDLVIEDFRITGFDVKGKGSSTIMLDNKHEGFALNVFKVQAFIGYQDSQINCGEGTRPLMIDPVARNWMRINFGRVDNTCVRGSPIINPVRFEELLKDQQDNNLTVYIQLTLVASYEQFSLLGIKQVNLKFNCTDLIASLDEKSGTKLAANSPLPCHNIKND